MADTDAWLPLNRLEAGTAQSFAQGSLILGQNRSNKAQPWSIGVRVGTASVFAVTGWYEDRLKRGTVWDFDAQDLLFGIQATDDWTSELEFNLSAPMIAEPDGRMVAGLVSLARSGIILHGVQTYGPRRVEQLIDFRDWSCSETPQLHSSTWIEDWRLVLRFAEDRVVTIEPGPRVGK
jgi:hypothetical protein